MAACCQLPAVDIRSESVCDEPAEDTDTVHTSRSAKACRRCARNSQRSEYSRVESNRGGTYGGHYRNSRHRRCELVSDSQPADCDLGVCSCASRIVFVSFTRAISLEYIECKDVIRALVFVLSRNNPSSFGDLFSGMYSDLCQTLTLKANNVHHNSSIKRVCVGLL